jgi:hypothetical protein
MFTIAMMKRKKKRNEKDHFFEFQKETTKSGVLIIG